MKLPDYRALGPNPETRSGAMTPQIELKDLGAIGQGGAAIGAGLDKIGNAFSEIAKKDEAEQNQLEQARAKSYFLTRKAEIEGGLEGDRDYETLGTRYQEQMNQARQEAGGMIRNPRRREIFDLGIADDVVRGTNWADKKARAVAADARIADAEGIINRNLEVIGRTTDPTDRAKLVQSTQDMIDGLHAGGYIDARTAGQLRRDWVGKLGVAWADGLSPEQRVEALRPYMARPDESKAAAKNPRAAAVGTQQEAPPQPRSYGDYAFPYSVPGAAGGIAVDRLKKAGVWDDLPKPLQEKFTKAGFFGTIEISKADADSVPDATWRKLAPVIPGMPVPAEPAKPAAGKQSDAAPPESAGSVTVGGRPGEAMRFFMQKGMSREDAAAMVWNFQQESGKGMNPSSVHDGGIGVGLAGWNKDRRAALQALAAERGTSETDFQTQLEFAWRELNGRESAAFQRIQAAETPEAKARAAITYFRPRADYAANRASEAGGVRALLRGDVPAGNDAPVVRTGTPLDFVPQAVREKMFEAAQSAVLQRRTAASVTHGDDLELQIINAGAGKGALPDRTAIESDPLLTSDRRNKLLRQHDAAVGDIATFQRVMTKFQNPNGGSFNPYDKDEKGAVDKIYEALGGGAPALQAVVERTGMMPEGVATKLRGGLVSQNPAEVQTALQVLTKVYGINPNAFTNVSGKDDFESAVIGFRHDVQDVGMTADAAALKYMKEQTSEYKATVKARIKAEDVDKLIKDKVTINYLENRFDDAWFSPDPKIGLSHGERLKMLATIQEVTKQRYLSSDHDIGKAAAIAVDQIKKTWGLTEVNGTKRVVPYAPEVSPGWRGVPNASELIANDAIATIKAETGQTVERSKLHISPIEGRTAEAFKAGQPTPYAISWEDKNGVQQVLQPGAGKFFVPDSTAARQAVAAERQKQFEAERTIVENQKPLLPVEARKRSSEAAAITDEARADRNARIDTLRKRQDGMVLP
jgi:hypothetical protein